MEIHHYTRASTLPLILQSGKIRFTRADQLDDGSEMPFKTAHIDACNFFVSSWTSVVTEHSGQWFRYGDRHRGVRITMPNNPFEFHRLNLEISRNCIAPYLRDSKVGIRIKDVNAPFSIEDMLGQGYVMTPYADDMSKDFGGKVEYVASPAKRAAELFSENDGETTFDDSGKLGRIKAEAWADQAEYRFVLMAMEGPNLDRLRSEHSYDEALLNLYESNLIAGRMGSTQVKFIDLPLAKGSIDQMLVTLGSHISVDDREAIMNAVSMYAPRARVIESCMNVRAI